MHIPKLLPDEHSKGYIGRINRLNGNIPLSRLQNSLANMLNIKDGNSGRYNILDVLALVSQVGHKRFVNDHTLIPFLKIVSSESDHSENGTTNSYNQLNYSAFVLPYNQAKFCLDCITEDRLTIGFSYWRRSHQLPGIVFCFTHKSVLFQEHGNTPAFMMPNEIITTAEIIDEKIANNALQNPFIYRYAEVCYAFLKSKSSIHSATAATRIAKQAEKHAFFSGTINDQVNNLNSLAISKVGGPWFDHFFSPHKIQNRRNSINIGRVLNKSSSAQSSAYALALAIFWDDPDLAYHDFCNNPRLPQSATICPKTISTE